MDEIITEVKADGLKALLELKCPNHKVVVNKPARYTGAWFYDIHTDDDIVVVAWHGKGFGIATVSTCVPFEGAHENYTSMRQAIDRIAHLVESGEKTKGR